MNVTRGEGRLAQRHENALEIPELFLGLLAIVIAGRRKVRHQAFEGDSRRCNRGLDRSRNRFRGRACAEPAHSRIDLQVVGDADGAQIFERRDYRCQLKRRQRRAHLGQEIGHDEDSRAEAGLAQRDALFHARHGQPLGALRFERPGDLDRAVTVSVSLHHRHEVHRIADQRPNGAVIGANLGERNLHPPSHGMTSQPGFCLLASFTSKFSYASVTASQL